MMHIWFDFLNLWKKKVLFKSLNALNMSKDSWFASNLEHWNFCKYCILFQKTFHYSNYSYSPCWGPSHLFYPLEIWFPIGNCGDPSWAHNHFWNTCQGELYAGTWSTCVCIHVTSKIQIRSWRLERYMLFKTS